MNSVYKECPRCKTPAIISAAICPKCGRVFRSTAPAASSSTVPDYLASRKQPRVERSRGQRRLAGLIRWAMLAAVALLLLGYAWQAISTTMSDGVLPTSVASKSGRTQHIPVPDGRIASSTGIVQPGPVAEREGIFTVAGSAQEQPTIHITNAEMCDMTVRFMDGVYTFTLRAGPNGEGEVQLPPGTYGLEVTCNAPGVEPTLGSAVFRKHKQYTATIEHGSDPGPMFLGDQD